MTLTQNISSHIQLVTQTFKNTRKVNVLTDFNKQHSYMVYLSPFTWYATWLARMQTEMDSF